MDHVVHKVLTKLKVILFEGLKIIKELKQVIQAFLLTNLFLKRHRLYLRIFLIQFFLMSWLIWLLSFNLVYFFSFAFHLFNLFINFFLVQSFLLN